MKMPSLPLPSTAATVDDAVIGAVSSIPLPPPSTMTPIAAVDVHHCCCHTVDGDNCQKPVGIVCCQRQQWRSAAAQLTVNGRGGLT
jgi:hypothetical protein